MLRHLSIQDVVLIEQVNLDLPHGMAAFTGETGAGKSIILDALGLALGQRSETRLIRQGCDKASVTAEFEITNPALAADLTTLLAQYEFSFTPQMILRRVLSSDGRSRAFLNDYPVSIALLKEIGDRLVEIHGQFATQKLLEPKAHRAILDQFAGHDDLVRETAQAWDTWQATQKQLASVRDAIIQAQREQDYLQHSVAELRDLNPLDGEEVELVAQRTVLQHAEKIHNSLSETEQHIAMDMGIRGRLHQSLRVLERIRDQAGDTLQPALDALERAAIEVDEAEQVIADLRRTIISDGVTQEKIDDRLFALRGAARKYQTTCDGLVNVLADYEQKLSLLDHQSRDIAQLEQQDKQQRHTYETSALALRAARQAQSVQLAQLVMQELIPLKLDKAQFVVDLSDKPEAQWNASGMDDVVFLLSTNPGAAPAPLHKIASGGEMARFMLALKVVTHAKGDTPTLVFDEVDTGIGGAVAAAVGARLRRLGQQAQVLVVTHSPQVAAHGHTHLLIEKQSDAASTRTHVQILDHDVRTQEIARMLAGSSVTTAALDAAAHLLEQAQHDPVVVDKKPSVKKSSPAKTSAKSAAKPVAKEKATKSVSARGSARKAS
jgi:DNA repair protein RecN (Recombination protein N)